ncbi:hypothetical protein KIPB_007826 [Kipferlia bialata]|uniref:Thioredoxin domain-containing protein n=1 Tax=Kipferlia bialata TaxID=797122 RepID=A0A9K3GKU2_9EUKA|nr:hypothetical protein KIPB_007826 [Kipferlia bialata]|eukprot:g7826.t1
MHILVCLSLVLIAWGSLVEVSHEAISDLESSPTPALVRFYMPWSGHCKHLAPTWKDLADALDGDTLTVAQINCWDWERETSVCEDMELRGYPTIMYLHNGTTETYEGPRTVEAMSSWTKKMVQGGEVIGDL